MLTEQSIAAARTPDQALDELTKMSGTGFDGMLVRMLLRELKSERHVVERDSVARSVFASSPKTTLLRAYIAVGTLAHLQLNPKTGNYKPCPFLFLSPAKWPSSPAVRAVSVRLRYVCSSRQARKLYSAIRKRASKRRL